MPEPEPQVEEASGYGVIANWLSKMGIRAIRQDLRNQNNGKGKIPKNYSRNQKGEG